MNNYKNYLVWKKRNPQRFKAHKAVFVAKRNKTLVQGPCAVCGEEKSEAHHEDYSKPLEVTWLCKKHHVEADKERRRRLQSIKG